MKSKVEKIENSKDIKLEITVEAVKFDAAINDVFKKSAHYFNIPGFRKGKAPMNMVEKMYGTEIFYEDAFNEVVPEAYEEALKEKIGHTPLEVLGGSLLGIIISIVYSYIYY